MLSSVMGENWKALQGLGNETKVASNDSWNNNLKLLLYVLYSRSGLTKGTGSGRGNKNEWNKRAQPPIPSQRVFTIKFQLHIRYLYIAPEMILLDSWIFHSFDHCLVNYLRKKTCTRAYITSVGGIIIPYRWERLQAPPNIWIFHHSLQIMYRYLQHRHQQRTCLTFIGSSISTIYSSSSSLPSKSELCCSSSSTFPEPSSSGSSRFFFPGSFFLLPMIFR